MGDLDLSDAQLARLDANMIGCFRLLAEAINGGRTSNLGSIALAATGAPTAAFNVAFVTRPLEDPATEIASALDWFKQQSLPCSIRLRAELDPAAGRACRAAGLAHVDTMPAMFMPDINGAAVSAEDLDILTAREPDAAADHARVVAGAFDMPLNLAALLVSGPLLECPQMEIYIGYHAGYPVCASSLIVTGGVAGVYNVATLPVYRNRGYGEAMTSHAIQRGAALGCEVATLQSTDAGHRIYERMGFRTVAHYLTYQRRGGR